VRYLSYGVDEMWLDADVWTQRPCFLQRCGSVNQNEREMQSLCTRIAIFLLATLVKYPPYKSFSKICPLRFAAMRIGDLSENKLLHQVKCLPNVTKECMMVLW
jgi:hypothetical protein